MDRVVFKKRREIVWLGDSRKVLKSFPKEVRQRLGKDLFRLELGLEATHYRPFAPSIFELREQDERAWYRVIYYVKLKNFIYVLHVFEKESAKTSKQDRRTIDLRLKQVPKA